MIEMSAGLKRLKRVGKSKSVCCVFNYFHYIKLYKRTIDVSIICEKGDSCILFTIPLAAMRAVYFSSSLFTLMLISSNISWIAPGAEISKENVCTCTCINGDTVSYYLVRATPVIKRCTNRICHLCFTSLKGIFLRQGLLLLWMFYSEGDATFQ